MHDNDDRNNWFSKADGWQKHMVEQYKENWEIFCLNTLRPVFLHVGMQFVGDREPSRAPLLWVQDRVSRREAGRPYLPGLPYQFGFESCTLNAQESAVDNISIDVR